MEKSEIRDIIRSHSEISYEEGWRQALQAGLCRVDFESAWAEAQGAKAKDESDRRIEGLQGEMRRSGKRAREWALGDWKAHFAGKGVRDDECELAFALFHAKDALGPLSTVWMRRMAILLAILSVAFGLWLGGRSDGNSVAGFAWTLLSLVSFFVCFLALGAQFRGNALKIVEYELGAEHLDPAEWLLKWQGAGFGFLGVPGARLTRLSRIRHEGKTTYFGEYVHREGEGAYSYQISRFLVAQELRKGLPGIHCVREWRTSSTLFKSPLKTGNAALDRVFTSFSENTQAAIELLGHGVASLLVEKGDQTPIHSFEGAGNTSILLLAPISLQTDIRFAGPVIRFDDYHRIKRGIVGHLELATKINNRI